MYLHNMPYNTDFNKLVYKEYGRNIQRLIEGVVEIEDRNKRNQAAYAIIHLMGQMHPHLKNIEEFRRKLWDQLYALSDFKLEIDGPYDKPTREEVGQKPIKLDYPQQDRMKFKHYGKNVESLIAKAVEMEDPAKKMAFAKVIAGYMKMVYKSWNQDFVNDELIKSDLLSMSQGELNLLEEYNVVTPKANRTKRNNYSSGGYSSHQSRGRSSNGRSNNGSYYGSNSGGSQHKRRNKDR